MVVLKLAVSVQVETINMDKFKIIVIILKILEMEELSNHGTMLPQDMIGLTEEQITELKLIDTWSERCPPSGGFIKNKDPIGRRNGMQPKPNMQSVIKNAIEEAKLIVGKQKVTMSVVLTQKDIQNALDILRGATTIVYPMQLPPHDPIRMELTNTEDLSGTHAQIEVIEPVKGQIWFAGRHLMPDKCVSDYFKVNNSKVIVKLVKHGEGAPGREPVVNEETRKLMMMQAYRRQEELKVSEKYISSQIFLNRLTSHVYGKLVQEMVNN